MRAMWFDVNRSKIHVTQESDGYVGNRYLWRITSMKNTISITENYTKPKKMTDTLSAVVESFSPSGSTLYEKVKSIHDYVCELTTYDSGGRYVYSAYGSLVDNRAVCEGYAEAFKLLCDKSGIECILVSGKGKNDSATENHMWNYVKMDDGKWYAVDTTWDDGNKISEAYLLVGSKTIVNTANDTEFSDNHFPSGDVSGTGLKVFELPTLSVQSYKENNEAFLNSDGSQSKKASKKEASASLRYYFNQLSKEQKNFYNALLKIEPPIGDDGETDDPTTENITSFTDTTAETTQKNETTLHESASSQGIITTEPSGGIGETIENILRVIIIVSAILALFWFLIVTIIKFSSREN